MNCTRITHFDIFSFFSSGGGGPQSNMYFVPYLLFFGVYLLLSSQSYGDEDKKLVAFIAENSPERLIKRCYEVEGPLYHLCSCLALRSYKEWKNIRIQLLRRLIVTANIYHFNVTTEENLIANYQKSILEYDIYKPFCLFWAFVNLSYSFFNQCETSVFGEEWTLTVSIICIVLTISKK